MMLTETMPVPAMALPVTALKAHLRLGSGFADDTFQDGLVEGYLRAALAVIEGRTAKMLIARDFRLELEGWREGGEQALPVGPVEDVAEVRIIDAAGVPAVVEPSRWRLVRDMHLPRLVGMAGLLPMVPEGGRIEIDFSAGFGVWDAVPADLRQAVFLLAAEYYEQRHEGGQRTGEGLPQAVQALIGRWRRVRVLGGGAR